MSGNKKLPEAVIENILKLLGEHPNGFELCKFQTSYFNMFGQFCYPEKYGFKTFGDMLHYKDLQNTCEFINNMKYVVLKHPRKATVLQPVSKSTNSQESSSPQSTSGSNFSGSLWNRPVSSGESTSSSSASDQRSRARLYPRVGSQTLSNISLGKRGGSERSGDGSKRPKDTFSRSNTNSETDFSESIVSITDQNKQKLNMERGKIVWIPREFASHYINFNHLILERVIQNSERSLYIDTTFCDRSTLEHLMDVKNLIRRVNSDKFTEIRARCNEFEFQKGSVFQHGAAIKMANIDVLMGMALSNPRGPDGANLVQSNELLYFVDVCGGPGGYAEYFLWKKKWEAKGFGITPKGLEHLEYDLSHAEHFPKESFESFYGESATEGLGQINRPYSVNKFITFVKDGTDQKGVHFMIASGGDNGNAAEEDQKEIRFKSTFLSELLIALHVVREGGHFVCRIYDLYAPFTVGLVYLMYRSFEQIAIFKPESCLPASSEKYIFCKWKKSFAQVSEVLNYLSECHKLDWFSRRSWRGEYEDFAEITHLLSVDRIRDSHRFYDYIRCANYELGTRQYVETSRMATSLKDGNEERYIEERLREIKDKCLLFWGIPERVREKPKYAKAKTPKIRALKLLTPYAHDFISQTDREGEIEMSMHALLSDLKNSKEWSFTAVGHERGFFMSLGNCRTFKYVAGSWNPVVDRIDLMNNTLVYADLVDEFEIKGVRQAIWTGFHIIDALVLGGKDVRALPSNERYDMIEKYALSMNKSSRDDLSRIRPKLTYELKNMKSFLKFVKPQKVRDRNGKFSVRYICETSLGEVTKFAIEGILFMKTVKENFAPADFRFCIQNRIYWLWSDNVNVTVPENFESIEYHVELEDQDEDNVVPVHAVTLLQHLGGYKKV